MLEEMERSARCGDPGELLQGSSGIRDGAKRESNHHGVEARVRERQMPGVGGNEFYRDRTLPGSPDRTAQHASMIVNADHLIGVPVVRDIQAGTDGDFENTSGGLSAQPLSLMAKPKSILRNHEEVVDSGKHRVRCLGHGPHHTQHLGRLRLVSQSPSKRTEVRRLPERGSYERDLINSILDEALICHVGFVHDGVPVVIPSIHARVGDTLYLHGSPASRMLRSMRSGDEISVNVTLLDGLVIARAAFHNSMNYRSVVVFGEPRIVTDDDEKLAALAAITDHVVPGRWADSRQMTEKEMKGTLVVALPLAEASAKTRAGGPGDDEADYDLPIWAGVVPLSMIPGEPIEDPLLRVDVPTPPELVDYQRPNGR